MSCSHLMSLACGPMSKALRKSTQSYVPSPPSVMPRRVGIWPKVEYRLLKPAYHRALVASLSTHLQSSNFKIDPYNFANKWAIMMFLVIGIRGVTRFQNGYSCVGGPCGRKSLTYSHVKYVTQQGRQFVSPVRDARLLAHPSPELLQSIIYHNGISHHTKME